MERLTREVSPALVDSFGIGPDTVATLLIAAGSNPDHLDSEAAFASLCGVSPIPASSGKTNRHRLNRGGHRQANAALHRIVVVRLRHDPRTQAYMHRRTQEGMSKAEVIRCLKRYVAREISSFRYGTPNMPLKTLLDLYRNIRLFGLGTVGLAQSHLEAHPQREVQHPPVPHWPLLLILAQSDHLGVVVEALAGYATQVLEGVDVALDEGGGVRPPDQFHVAGP